MSQQRKSQQWKLVLLRLHRFAQKTSRRHKQGHSKLVGEVNHEIPRGGLHGFMRHRKPNRGCLDLGIGTSLDMRNHKQNPMAYA
jgi:hypothetical protein